MFWREIEKELPKESESVLIRYIDETNNSYRYAIGMATNMLSKLNKGNPFFAINGGMRVDIKDVTNWSRIERPETPETMNIIWITDSYLKTVSKWRNNEEYLKEQDERAFNRRMERNYSPIFA